MEIELRQKAIKYFLNNRTCGEKIAGALFPDLYIISNRIKEMVNEFNHINLENGDQFNSQYLYFFNLFNNKIKLPSFEYLEMNPLENWQELKDNIRIRRFLLLHAYYHYHHQQFWKHFNYLKERGYFETDQIQKLDFLILKKALLMAFHYTKSDKKIREIFSLIIKYQSSLTESDNMFVQLQYAVMLTHKGDYKLAYDLFIKIERYFISQNTQIKIDYYNARALFYYKNGKFSLAMKDSCKALAYTNEDPVHLNKIRMIILKNIQKLKGGANNDR